MKLERVEIAGFFNFADPCTLDLTDLDGIIAVVGQNGNGKTRLLDAGLASIYGPGNSRAFPSREGTLADYATSRDAYIEATWLLGDKRYRTRTNVDAERRQAEASIEELIGKKRKLLNDGKVTTFKEVVGRLFPSQRSVLASAFAAQKGRGSFAELGQKERMELFVELADLAHLELRASTAKACAVAADRVLQAAGAVLAEMRRSALDPDVGSRLASLQERAATLEQELGEASQQASGRAEQVKALQVRAVEFVRLEAAAKAAGAVLSGTAKTVADIEAEAAQAAARADAAYKATSGRLDVATKRLEARKKALISTHAAAQTDRRERILNNESILSQSTDIHAAILATSEASAKLDRLVTLRSETMERLSKCQVDDRVASQALLKVEGERSKLLDAEKKVGILKVVKFGEKCADDPPCRFVSDASEAKQSLAELTAAVAQIPALKKVAEAAAAAVVSANAALKAISNDESTQRAVIETNKKTAALATDLKTAEARIGDLRQSIAAADTAHDADVASVESELKHAVEVAEKEDERTAIEYSDASEATETTLAAAVNLHTQAEIELRAATAKAAAESGAKTELDAAEEALKQVSARVISLTSSSATAAKDRDALAAEVEARRSAEMRVKDYSDAVDRGQVTQASWLLLARALGRDGLQRLEIDAAGPVVSDLANQLLSVGYGPRFSIQIVTQVATADRKDMKERFTIEVIDNEYGAKPRDIGDLSGGERVVVEEALRAALACYVNLRGRQRCLTLWRDETTGALSPENIAPYVAMLRKLRTLSGAEVILFVTHSTEAADLADAVIELNDGKATITSAYRSIA